MDIKRIIRHLVFFPWMMRRALSTADLRELGNAIRASEATHRGELRFAVEGTLEGGQLWQGLTARARAIELFSSLRIWDTAENNGVLIYLLLADRQVEIIADRGIHQKVGPEAWAAICLAMQKSFQRGDVKGGLLDGLREVSTILERDYPADGKMNPDELPNEPVVLR